MVLQVNGAARVRLAPGVSLQGATLRDDVSGATHDLNDAGAAGLAVIVGGGTFDAGCAVLRERWSAPDEQVRRDLVGLLDDLDRHDLIEVSGGGPHGALYAAGRLLRSPLLVLVSATSWLLAPPGRRAGRRHPATVMGVTRAVLSSQRVPLAMLGLGLPLASVLAVALVAGTDLVGATTGLASLLAHVWAAVGAFLVLTVLHELAHVAAARRVGATVLYIHSRGWVVSVMHSRLGRGREAAVGVAGPLAGFAAGAATALALHAYADEPLGLQTSFAATTMAVGLAQLASLGPWSQDGRSLFALLRSER